MATNSKNSETIEYEKDQASFLIAGITWQDSLLQAYRNYMVVTQSIFIAVGIVLFNSQASADTINDKIPFAFPFTVIAVIGLLTLNFLSGAIIERAKSVDWWQKRLLKYERSNLMNKHFITFRAAKEHSFKPPEVDAINLTEENIETLLRPDKPKARKVFGFFVPGFYFLWFILILSSIIDFPWNEIFA